MVTYSVTLPSGETATRKSKRVYTHAVVAYKLAFNDSEYVDVPVKSRFSDSIETPGWVVDSFSGSFELAQKAAAAAAKNWGRAYRDIQIVEVAR